MPKSEYELIHMEDEYIVNPNSGSLAESLTLKLKSVERADSRVEKAKTHLHNARALIIAAREELGSVDLIALSSEDSRNIDQDDREKLKNLQKESAKAETKLDEVYEILSRLR